MPLRLLLDTNVAYWSSGVSTRLPAEIVEEIADEANEVYVSIASVWEIAIKNGTGRRARFPISAQRALDDFRRIGLSVLNIQLSHVLAVEDLPALHRDPFNRLLVAQAQVERLTLLTSNAKLGEYGSLVRLV